MAFDADYANRDGFDVAFLRPGKLDGRVFLPVLGKKLAAQAAPLLGKKKGNVLEYHHYSVVLHKARRFAIYSAASIDFSGRFAIPRNKDVWRVDPRLDAALQVTGDCYRNNQFDRGHLTRREDLEYGATEADAVASANDTCHWTNCTPQAAKFNEGKQLWAGLELHILERAVEKDRFRAQVITGPVFDAGDPVIPGFPGLRYPLRYWKVVAAINASGKLFATAYVLDQRGQIEAATRAAPEDAVHGVQDVPDHDREHRVADRSVVHLRAGRQAGVARDLRSARQDQGRRRLPADRVVRRRRAPRVARSRGPGRRANGMRRFQRGPLAQSVRAEDS